MIGIPELLLILARLLLNQTIQHGDPLVFFLELVLQLTHEFAHGSRQAAALLQRPCQQGAGSRHALAGLDQPELS